MKTKQKSWKNNKTPVGGKNKVGRILLVKKNKCESIKKHTNIAE